MLGTLFFPQFSWGNGNFWEREATACMGSEYTCHWCMKYFPWILPSKCDSFSPKIPKDPLLVPSLKLAWWYLQCIFATYRYIYIYVQMLVHLKILAQVWALKGNFKLRLNAKQCLKLDTLHVYKPLRFSQKFHLLSKDLALVGLYQISAVITQYHKNASNCCMSMNLC